MEKRRIDLSRCLVRDDKADCHRCEEICPQKAIRGHAIDMAACDGCGLCSAVCPAAAITAPEDYTGALAKAQSLTPQVLMCEKASEGSVHCLGFLTRRLLWALAAKRPLALDISHCEACRPAVFAHLKQEVEACNAALAKAGQAGIALVHVKPAPPKPKKTRKVERRSFFKALFHSTAEGLQEIAEAQIEHSYRFDAAAWLKAQQAEPCELFCGLALQRREAGGCTSCGLCAVVCPTDALVLERGEAAVLHFDAAACTGCNLCALHCPQGVLEILPHAGQRDFLLDR